jgi:[acyl-carrier-protein] S-malonyltransferase
MGTAWVDHPSFELVAYASEVVGRDLGELLLEADQDTLTRTANAQLATFVMSLVVLDAAERVGLEPVALAGHSLGEYTALVAAGALSFEDGLRLVAERGEAMQDAADLVSGTMTAVLGLGDDDVEAACMRAEGEVWVANYNAPGQVVIAGVPDALAAAATIAKSLGAKRVTSLPVGGAFHTPLMAPARDRLRKVLAEVVFHESDPTVVANVDARPHPDGAEWPGLLSAQLCSPVRWHQTLRAMHQAGARTFVELGPGGVLGGLVKRVLPAGEFRAFSVATPAELDELAEHLTFPGAGAAASVTPPLAPAERFAMTERLVVAPATGPFQPAPELAVWAPTLPGSSRQDAGSAQDHPAKARIGVGDLIGWAGESEVRSPFAGTLEGILVLAGERVVGGQPVAWLRAEREER